MVLDLNLSTLGIGQHDAAMIGFWSTVAGCSMGILLGWVADRVSLEAKQQYGGLKLFIVLMYVGALGFFGWFALMCCGGSGGDAGSTHKFPSSDSGSGSYYYSNDYPYVFAVTSAELNCKEWCPITHPNLLRRITPDFFDFMSDVVH